MTVTIGSKLKEFKEQNNLTNTQLEELTGISTAGISTLINDKTVDFNMTTIYKICKLLNISLDELLKDTIYEEKR